MAGEINIDLADELSPETVTNTIIRNHTTLDMRGASIMDALPMFSMGDSEEVYYRESGVILPMSKGSLHSEAPVGYLEGLEKDYRNVDTYENKVAPQLGSNFELNTSADVLNLYDRAGDYLERRMRLRREVTGWRGDTDVEGFIGADGQTPYSALDTEHVITPGTAFSDTDTSDPHGEFRAGMEEIDVDGFRLEEAGTPTAFMGADVMYDLLDNADLEGRYQGVQAQGLNQETLASILPVENIQPVYTKVPRTNANGEPIDTDGNVVDDPDDAAMDNVLSPYDAGSDTVRRNIVMGAPGTLSGVMPVLTDRLAELVGMGPIPGEFSVDNTIGFVSHMWADADPAVMWFKLAQEFGVELHAPDNWAIIQDI